ncbi:TOMM precursor leader peptide-binding protein [Lentzea tibetensis]|uniref:TOMM leader peptide-binding protein n=1 Tax=Lentzea tibetensis TaxID=2591470 RepID=A0A563ESG9_9PSEU|nr:TOMM precursor leader peptide-binding protein [Lentzea tibetensis]TWP50488.1 TOMM precursor leader peptide-binding protein [Lentzea tibetensis]
MHPDDRPRLRSHLAVRVVAPDEVFLLSESGHHLVRGEGEVAVVPLLDGTRSVGEIAAAVGDRASLAECLRALAKFRRLGLLADGLPDGVSVQATAAWDARGVDPGLAARVLGGATVALTAVGEVDVLGTAGALAVEGVRSRITPWQRVAAADFTIVLADDYLDPRLGELDAAMRTAGRSWLLAKPVGAEIWVGPHFRPGVTGCWWCLRERLDGNRPVGQYLRRSTGEDAPRTSRAALPHSIGVATHLIAGAAVTAVVTGELPALDGVLLSFDVAGLTSERHQLIQQPQCAGCGEPDLMRRPAEVRLSSRPAWFTTDGGYRVEPPESTSRRLEKHVGRLLGVVSSVRQLSDVDDELIFSYTAGHNFAVQGDSVDGLRRTLRGQSGGKGPTEAQAKASAVCEAIERYCGVWRDNYPVIRGSFAELGREKAVGVDDLLLFSPRQYADREQWNSSAAGRLHQVPERLDPARPISWTSAWSLTHERERLLPAAHTWFGHPDLVESAFCSPDANGNAAGNTVAEAVLQGFCELVERDAVALWWYNRARRPGVDLDGLGDPYVDALRDHLAGVGRELWVLDLTADLGIPVFAAVSRRVDHPVEDVLVGFGAHLDARVAVVRALTEHNQFLPAVSGRTSSGGADYREDDSSTLDWWRTVLVAEQPWLAPHPEAKHVPVHDLDRTGDLAEDVRSCVELARRAGLEVIVCDQSRPDIELSVVKVVVPGLRHFWRRLAPGRLYDVPAALGWVDEPVAESACNPISVFF